MRRAVSIRKQDGKLILPANIKNGMTPKALKKLSDTEYYQVGPAGDYVQSGGGV